MILSSKVEDTGLRIQASGLGHQVRVSATTAAYAQHIRHKGGRGCGFHDACAAALLQEEKYEEKALSLQGPKSILAKGMNQCTIVAAST